MDSYRNIRRVPTEGPMWKCRHFGGHAMHKRMDLGDMAWLAHLPARAGFSLLETTMAILVLAIGLTAMASGIKVQSDVRQATSMAKRYLDVARGFRERFDSLRYEDIGKAGTWSVWQDRDKGDDGIDEHGLMDLGLLANPTHSNLRVFISYRRAISVSGARGACDQGWDSGAKEPKEFETQPGQQDLETIWKNDAESWDIDPWLKGLSSPIAIRIRMVWKEDVRIPMMIGRIEKDADGTPLRVHDIYVVRSP